MRIILKIELVTSTSEQAKGGSVGKAQPTEFIPNKKVEMSVPKLAPVASQWATAR